MNFSLGQASSFAMDVDQLFKVLLGVSSLMVGLVWLGIIFFCIKYRKGSKADRKRPPDKSPWLEGLLISMIAAFGLTMFAWSTKIFFQMRRVPRDAIEIDVVAKQWVWVFHDPQGGDQINAVKVPLGKPVRLVMTSADVIHSFFVPEFRIKQDVLPGRYTDLWFQPQKLGRFAILCTQYCGLSHSRMRGYIDVVSEQDYRKGEGNPAVAVDLEHGRQLFTKRGCAGCHDPQYHIGPSLKNLFGSAVHLSDGSVVIADENYLRRSIFEPQAEIVQGYPGVMPSFQGQLSEEELLALIRYIKDGVKTP